MLLLSTKLFQAIKRRLDVPDCASKNEVTETTLAVTSKNPIIKEQYPKKKSISFHIQHDLTQKAPLHLRPPSAHKEAIPESQFLKFLADSH